MQCLLVCILLQLNALRRQILQRRVVVLAEDTLQFNSTDRLLTSFSDLHTGHLIVLSVLDGAIEDLG